MVVPKIDDTMMNMTSKGKICEIKVTSMHFSMTIYTSKTPNQSYLVSKMDINSLPTLFLTNIEIINIPLKIMT